MTKISIPKGEFEQALSMFKLATNDETSGPGMLRLRSDG